MKKIQDSYFIEWLPDKKIFFIFLIIALTVNCFVIYFISKENTVYYWDYVGYWRYFQYVSKYFMNDPFKAAAAFINSIRHADYNHLPVLFLIPFNSLLGGSRLSYILSLTNIYLFPSAILFFILIKKMISVPNRNESSLIYLISLLIFLLLPQMWLPLLLGYVGIGGVLIVYIIFLLMKGKMLEDQRIIHLTIIGVLLAVLILFRRWYAYWVLSFFVAHTLMILILLLQKDKSESGKYLYCFRNLLIVAVVFFITLFTIATPIAKIWLVRNHVDLYSSYHYGTNFFNKIKLTYDHLGSFLILITIIGFIQSFWDKKIRQFALFLIIQLAVAYVLITRVTVINVHHYYLFLPSIVIFISIFAIKTILALKIPAYKFVFICCFLSFFASNFFISFFPKAPHFLNKSNFLFTKFRHYPLVRNDLSEIKRLVTLLYEKILIEKNKDEKIYVLASSGIFNDDILRNACIDMGKNYDHRKILLVQHVDKMSGFPSLFLTAKYVLVAKPIQYHLDPNDQRVIGILAEEILNQRTIGKNYKKLSYEFIINKNIKIYIYEKVKHIKRATIEDLSKLFLKHYPDHKDIFEIKFNGDTNLLQNRYNISNDTILLMNYDKGYDGLGEFHQLSLLPDPEGLTLRSHGHDPHLALPLFNISSGKQLIVKIDITSPKDTVLQLYYATKSSPNYNEKQSIKRGVKKGKNVVFITLPLRDYLGHFRLDPGKIAGEFILHSIEVRGISKG